MRVLKEGNFELRKALVIQAQLRITSFLMFLRLKISSTHYYIIFVFSKNFKTSNVYKFSVLVYSHILL